MKNSVENLLFVVGIALTIGAIAFLITWGVKSMDSESWNGPVNGCYTHSVSHNYFWTHADYKTNYVYCRTN